MPPHEASLVVDGHLPELRLHPAIKAACRRLLPGWAECFEEDVEIGFIAGGISNALFKVAPALPPPEAPSEGRRAVLPPVAFRIYGDNTEQFIDRTRELALMQLAHEHGFGPRVLATFGNGRIEQFLPMRSLQASHVLRW